MAVRVLVVEDSDLDAELLRRTLRSGDFEIQRVETLRAALEQLRAHSYDVVLLDLSLPDGHGFDLFLAIRSHAPHSAIIVLTGLDDEALGLKMVHDGAQDYLVKGSLGPSHMVRAIRQACERKRAEEVTQHYAHELSMRNAEMRADLQLAREVQQAFVTNHCPIFPPRSATPCLRFEHRYAPAGAVGGDFFSIFPVSEQQAGVMLCDVMGHGVRAALITAMLRALIGSHAAAATDPTQMMLELNKELRAMLRDSESVVFVTALYAIINAVSGEIRWANAGHPGPERVSRDRMVGPLNQNGEPVGPLLGLVEAPSYRTQGASLVAGDRVLFFTDGVSEIEGRSGECTGLPRLEQELQAGVGQPPGRFLDSLLETLRASAAGGAFSDDVCVLTMDVEHLL